MTKSRKFDASQVLVNEEIVSELKILGHTPDKAYDIARAIAQGDQIAKDYFKAATGLIAVE
jgi:hypothetical protein